MTCRKSAARIFFQSTFYGILLQFVCRLANFFINIQIARNTDPSVLGLVNVKLILYQTTVLTLSREPFRKALSSSTNYSDVAMIVKWIPLIGLILSFILGPIWMFLLAPVPQVVHYRASLVCFIISTLIDQFSESSWYILRIYGKIKTNILMDVVSNLARTLFVVCILKLNLLHSENAILILSLGYLIQSICGYLLNRLASSYYSQQSLQKSYSPPSVLMITQFFKQTLVKQALTECERYIMALSTFIPLREQGIYDTITNITSLVPRLIYAPVEESVYVFLSKTLPRPDSISLSTSDNRTSYKYGIQIFTYTQRLFSIVGICLLAFGLALSNDILLFYFGSSNKVTNQHILMMDFSFAYVSIISLNGISEAFLFATLSSFEMEYQNKKMAVLSLVYVILCIITTPFMHAYGFIFAQCVVMILRILTSIKHIQSYCKNLRISWSIWKTFTPHPVLMLTVITGSILLLLEFPILSSVMSFFGHWNILPVTTENSARMIRRCGDVLVVLFCTALVFVKFEKKLILFVVSCIF